MLIENLHAKPDCKQFRILSLDGGCAKGVYTLGVLKEAEALANAACARHSILSMG
jgi:patatin-like phospholipase/acyl hydrolase